jgi:hypothetical protein
MDIIAFVHFIQNSKILRIAFWVNFLYYIVIQITFLIYNQLGLLNTTVLAIDFRVFIQAVQLLQNAPNQLYSSPLYNLPFRYFPFFAYFFYPLQFLPFPVAFIVNNTIMFVTYLATSFFIFELCIRFYHVDRNGEFLQLIMFYFILAPIQVMNYVFGQINNLFLFAVILSMFFFENHNQKVWRLKSNEIWGGIALGFAILLKPIAIIIIPFVLNITINLQASKKIIIEFYSCIKRLFGIFIVLLPNVILFIIYPGLTQGFMSVNFQNTLDYYPSTSITRYFIDIFSAEGLSSNKLILIVIITVCLIVIPFWQYLKASKDHLNYSLYFTFAMLIVLLAYPDSWFLYLLFFFGTMIPDLTSKDLHYNPIQNVKFLTLKQLVKYLEVYFFVAIIIYYLIGKFDPLTPILLIGVYVLECYFNSKVPA